MSHRVVVGGRRGWQPPTATPSRGGRGQRGAVTAEAAVVLPVLVAVTLGLVWLIGVAVAQVRVVDAARETARAAARGETDAVAGAAGRAVAPGSAVVVIRRDGDVVRVETTAEVKGPGGLFRFLPGVAVRSRAVARVEPEGGAS